MNNFLAQRTEVFLEGSGAARNYALRLLEDVGATVIGSDNKQGCSPGERWLASGLGDLTGFTHEPPGTCPIALASVGDGALAAVQALAGRELPTQLQGAELMALRAAMTGLSRQGSTSPGGSCRILPSRDGHIAVNLARDSDWRLLQAWLLAPTPPDWPSVAARIRDLSKAELIAQGRLLGLAVTDASPPLPGAGGWFDLAQHQRPLAGKRLPPRVIDLSSLWAGPLCSRLLQWAGAEVVKVESTQRPDGARLGSPEFFEFLNSDKQHVQLALHEPRGHDELMELIRSADIVIEGSRPRALRQMGIEAEQLLRDVPGLSWIGISGYGRREPEANWIAYGDDAGVAAGLSAILHQATGQWMFCGDAIADPLTGMHAAVAALASWHGGGGHLVSLSLVETVQHCIRFAMEPDTSWPS